MCCVEKGEKPELDKSNFQQEEPDSAPAGPGGFSLRKKGIAVLAPSQLPACPRCSSRGFPACWAMEWWCGLSSKSSFLKRFRKDPNFCPEPTWKWEQTQKNHIPKKTFHKASIPRKAVPTCAWRSAVPKDGNRADKTDLKHINEYWILFRTLGFLTYSST